MKYIKKFEKEKLYVYYHIGAIDDDYKVMVEEQVALLIKSELYDAADKIFYSIVGKQDINLPEKFECVYSNEDFTVAELPIINIILKHAQTEDFKCLYFHTKGSAANYLNHLKSEEIAWRKYMEYFNIELWKKNVKLLDDYDTVGVNYRKKNSWHLDHYSGNFWWSKSKYLKTLDDVNNVKINENRNRYKAEMWVLSGLKPNYYCCFDIDPKLFNIKNII